MHQRLQCLPSVHSMDFAIGGEQLLEILSADQAALYGELLQGALVKPSASQLTLNYLLALQDWQLGCDALADKRYTAALKLFQQAEQSQPLAKMYGLSSALAMMALEQYDEVSLYLARQESLWLGDERYNVAMAMISLHRESLNAAQRWTKPEALARWVSLDDPTVQSILAQGVDEALLDKLKSIDSIDWRVYANKIILMEQYYFSLLWQKQYQSAAGYAKSIITLLEAKGIVSARWQERFADALFKLQRYDQAVSEYTKAYKKDWDYWHVRLKEADIYFLQGKLELEREIRQSVYGKFK